MKNARCPLLAQNHDLWKCNLCVEAVEGTILGLACVICSRSYSSSVRYSCRSIRFTIKYMNNNTRQTLRVHIATAVIRRLKQKGGGHTPRDDTVESLGKYKCCACYLICDPCNEPNNNKYQTKDDRFTRRSRYNRPHSNIAILTEWRRNSHVHGRNLSRGTSNALCSDLLRRDVNARMRREINRFCCHRQSHFLFIYANI